MFVTVVPDTCWFTMLFSFVACTRRSQMNRLATWTTSSVQILLTLSMTPCLPPARITLWTAGVMLVQGKYVKHSCICIMFYWDKVLLVGWTDS